MKQIFLMKLKFLSDSNKPIEEIEMEKYATKGENVRNQEMKNLKIFQLK